MEYTGKLQYSLVQVILIVLGKAPLKRNVIAINQLNNTVINSLGWMVKVQFLMKAIV